MPKAVRYHKQGGPEVLQVEEVPLGEPGPGQARVRHKAIGVNFVDTYQRSGLYKMPLPFVAGSEGAGEVTAVAQARDIATVKNIVDANQDAFTSSDFVAVNNAFTLLNRDILGGASSDSCH